MSNPPSRLCAFPYPSEYDQPRPTVTVQKGMYFDPHDADELNEIEEILDEYDLNQQMEDISNPESVEERMPVDVQGHAVHRERYRALCRRYIDRFSHKVRLEPARVTPMRIELDDDAWLAANNQGKIRIQGTEKEAVIAEFIEKLSSGGVISRSQSKRYSHPTLTRKSNGSWRLCIDFRRLNKHSKKSSYPLPHINTMLARIGSRKPRVFAVFDLTQGFYQAPLHPDSRACTAFMTFMGLFEWNRVPMGIKGAPTYFQEVMESEVLSGLLHSICELYMDDLILYANSEDQLLEHMELLFQRLREYNITLNPAKAHIGLEEIEYVGHLLSATGISFTSDKISKVVELPRPTVKHELKRFLGLVNYFRDHLMNLAFYTQPLQSLLTNYKKDDPTPIQWTEETLEAYNAVMGLLRTLPKLWYLDDNKEFPIHLYTDASNLGFGAYLCQKVPSENSPRPIAFLSRSCQGSERTGAL